MPKVEIDEWDTDKICELLQNTETFYLTAKTCRTPWALRTYVAWLYGNCKDHQLVEWTKASIPDLDTVDWNEVLKVIESE